MPMPKSVIKFDKNGFKFESSVNKANYTIKELSRAALRDSGKFIVREARKKARRRTGKGRLAIQYWNRARECDLQIGYKANHRGFPLSFYELGVNNLPKDALITNTVEQNITNIRKIQAQYLSAIEDELTALGLLDESENFGGENE